jgi:hypothetical protein
VTKDNAYLADLLLTDPRDDKDRIADTKGGLFYGASSWTLDHNSFRRWCNANDARLLWVKGDPGKGGKIMLLITIVEELGCLLKQQHHIASSLTTLSCFFCQGTDRNLNSATAILRGLIYLLCILRPFLAEHLRRATTTLARSFSKTRTRSMPFGMCLSARYTTTASREHT